MEDASSTNSMAANDVEIDKLSYSFLMSHELVVIVNEILPVGE